MFEITMFFLRKNGVLSPKVGPFSFENPILRVKSKLFMLREVGLRAIYSLERWKRRSFSDNHIEG